MGKSLLIAGIGGFLGTVFRFLIFRYIQDSWFSVFPWGTLIVNVSGSFLLGIFLAISEKGSVMPDEWRVFLTVGFCGGFTTFSTFSNDVFVLLQNRELFRVALYASLSFFLGLLAVFAGRLLTRLI